MNIYISNLSYRIVESDLKQLFEKYGEVASTKVIIDHQSGRSKSFGFVEMPDKEAMQNAISNLNRTLYDGKLINVTESRSREERPSIGASRPADRNRRRSSVESEKTE